MCYIVLHKLHSNSLACSDSDMLRRLINCRIINLLLLLLLLLFVPTCAKPVGVNIKEKC